ncbi:MAG: hypothetical protein GF320_03930, partial [Armatimonadia bacterium]|nr:hypothetical protein [Armatimonadia bacterium]
MPRQLGDILLEQQVVTRDELDAALAAQTSSDERIGKILVDLGYVSYQDVARALATQMDLSLFGPERINIHDDSWAKLPVDFCLEHALAPVERPDGSLTICMADPLDLAVLEQARQEIGVSAEPAVAAADDIRAALASRMGRQAALDALRRTMPVEGSVEVLQDAVSAAEPGETEEELLESVDRTISALLASALHGGADMVLGDPRANGVMFRLRTSNQMRDLLLLPSHVHGPLAGRIADLAGIESPFRTPGSGHFRVTHADQVVDVRVSMTPTVRGLRVMLRIVAAEERPPDLHAIGLSAKAQDLVYRALSEQGSAVLVAGILPAGRRQTLQSCLSILPLDSYNVVAIEEGATGRAIAGVAQIDPGADRERYSEAVRTGMLQDPDVLVVSQLRDQASAETALEAALDGRIVLAAVPAATTRGALEFLLDLGVDERLLAHAATLVLCHHM